jgi:hypothetical protein
VFSGFLAGDILWGWRIIPDKKPQLSGKIVSQICGLKVLLKNF